jgi:RNA polymerase sigma-70 factor, ECF subfamily
MGVSTFPVTAALADILNGAIALDAPPADQRETAEVRALVDAARAGDRDAFGALVAMNERAILRAALAALDDRADAEDAAQDACLMAWRKLPGFRGDATFRTWLLAIVWRKALDRRRRRKLWWNRAATGTQERVAEVLDRLTASEADPERAAVSRDLMARASAGIRALSPKLRDVLLLATSGEHSYAEIAAMLKIPLGTVKWRISEARRVLGLRLNT